MQLHQVELMGRSFRIRTEDPGEHVEAVAEYVNEQIAEVSDGHRHVAVQNVLLLASLNMADELFKLRQRHDALRSRIRSQSLSLLEKMKD